MCSFSRLRPISNRQQQRSTARRTLPPRVLHASPSPTARLHVALSKWSTQELPCSLPIQSLPLCSFFRPAMAEPTGAAAATTKFPTPAAPFLDSSPPQKLHATLSTPDRFSLSFIAGKGPADQSRGRVRHWRRHELGLTWPGLSVHPLVSLSLVPSST